MAKGNIILSLSTYRASALIVAKSIASDIHFHFNPSHTRGKFPTGYALFEESSVRCFRKSDYYLFGPEVVGNTKNWQSGLQQPRG